MPFNIIESSKNISRKYQRYLRTTFDIKEENENSHDYKDLFLKELNNGNPFSKGPYLDVVDSFEKGESVENLIKQGFLSKDFKFIPNIYNKTLFKHQEISLKKSLENKNLVVSTGTGSGKTESFLIPILNELMREKENGTLCPGVRALIIYPMNALANDQIERLRDYLSNYNYITFGCYTGQTENTENKALKEYEKLNGTKSKLTNELISRDAMKETPPHILITNYAMLEYLMLRPEDSVFFDGEYSNNWKYIVLDEAHTYTGSTGIEVSFLLRRVLSKLNNPKIKYILTSATLGSENTNKEVVEFASKLCNAEFREEDVIRAHRVDLTKEKNISLTLSIEFYNTVGKLIENGYEDSYIINEIKSNFNIDEQGESLPEFLYNLLLKDKTYWIIKEFLKEPKSTEEICNNFHLTSEELSNFVNVASFANKNRTKLFDSRYHYFLRATEGVFITLAPHKNLFLTRKNIDYYNGTPYKVFEIVTCTQCHAIYLIGKIQDNHLEQMSTFSSQSIKTAFYLGDKLNDNDEDDSLADEELETNTFELCPHCGFIRKKNIINKGKCVHNESEYVTVIRVENTNKENGRITKCVCCEGVNRLGILRSFFTGQESTTSVIGTALFEELPGYTLKTITHNVESQKDEFDDFGFDDPITLKPQNSTQKEKIKKTKQFIAFSDSRQAAAYFSTYFSETYQGILYGKIINDIIKEKSPQNLPIKSFIRSLTVKLEKNKIHNFEEHHPDYELEAWKALLKELIDNKSRNSLIGLGLASIDFIDSVSFGSPKKLNLSEDEFKSIILIFIMGMISDVAIYYNKDIPKSEMDYFTHNGIEFTYSKEGVSTKGKKNYIKAFLPKSKTNKRVEYLKKVFKAKGLDFSDEYVKSILGKIWDLMQNKEILTNLGDNEHNYKVDSNLLTLGNNRKWYICQKCKKLTTYNVGDVCPTYLCDGKLESINVDDLEKGNHYYRLYNDLIIENLNVVEHTAQLEHKTASDYQNKFKNKEINVLSCSTTFEMGVDVGDLETVFMRNMPPSPSNYIQRAGRAGRSSNSAALALTFCNKSNHDFNYFKNPISMINGVIMPPIFKTDNEKIAIRHLYSSALAFFWKKYKEYFSTAKDMMEGTETSQISGYELLKNYLQSKPQDLKQYLKNFLPESLIEKFGIENFVWVNWLFDSPQDNYPNLDKVRNIYLNDVNELRKAKEERYNKNNLMNSIITMLNNIEDENIISFFSKNGILPKYGFPVDTVNLELNKNSKVDSTVNLSRDLSMAISEYAPGCQVIANGRLITSRYIKKEPTKNWRMYDYFTCNNCKTLNIKLHTTEKIKEFNCSLCGTENTKTNIFLIPEFGFIAETETEIPTLIRPEKTYRTDASLISRGDKINEQKFEFKNISLTLESINNGSMAICTTDNFYVCTTCGYACEPSEIGKSGFIEMFSIQDKKHKNVNGYYCPNNKLHKYALGYYFETDVVKIRFNKMTTSSDEAYSILQSLILSACKVLNIDNNEISGCLQYYDSSTYSYILYDKTPGGAGHVKRLCNYETIKNFIAQAFKIANDCTCGGEEGDSSCYNCLRTYQNQRNHDIIKRCYVKNYFKNVL